jgi:hypothetical protein
VSGYSNWAGAYSTSGPLLVISSLLPTNHGDAGLELVFHEAMHQWDQPIFAKLSEIARGTPAESRPLGSPESRRPSSSRAARVTVTCAQDSARRACLVRLGSSAHFLKFRAPEAINPGIFRSEYFSRIADTSSVGVAEDAMRRSKSLKYVCMNVSTSGESGAAMSAL